MIRIKTLCVLPFLLLACWTQTPPSQKVQNENLFLVTLDGLRWQELFRGADPILIGNQQYVDDPEYLAERFWDDDPIKRREKLMPFFWKVIAQQGQLFGNRSYGNKVSVTNDHRFSYPGYSEILTGFADKRIDSNDKINNPNQTVLEFVHQQPGFSGRVAAFASWDVFPYILNQKRSGIPVYAGFGYVADASPSQLELFLNELQKQIPRRWSSVRYDAFTHHYALEYLKKQCPRLLYVAYGETDDFAHDGAYDDYLQSAHQADAFIQALWGRAQADDSYSNKTTLLITTDHGRGKGDDWTAHGADIEGAEAIWFAVIGPATPPLGEIKTEDQFYQNQVAKTAAAFLGLTYENSEVAVGDVVKQMIDR